MNLIRENKKIIVEVLLFFSIQIFVSFIVVRFFLKSHTLDYSVGLFDKVDWIVDFSKSFSLVLKEKKLLGRIANSPQIVRPYYELGDLYLYKKNDYEKAIKYYQLGHENDKANNFDFNLKIYHAHILNVKNSFNLEEYWYSYLEDDYNTWTTTWKEKFQKANDLYIVSSNMNLSLNQNSQEFLDNVILEGDLYFYDALQKFLAGDSKAANELFSFAEYRFKYCMALKPEEGTCYARLALTKLRRIPENETEKKNLDLEAYWLLMRNFELMPEAGKKFAKAIFLSEYFYKDFSYFIGNLELVEDLTDEMTRERPRVGDFYHSLAMAYLYNFEEKNIPKMLKQFKRAYRYKNDSLGFCVDLGYYTGYYLNAKKGIDILENCKDAHYKSYPLLSYLGDLYLLQGEYDKALESHLEAETNEQFALDRQSNYTSLTNRYSIGKVYLSQGKKDEAIEYIKSSCNNQNGLKLACEKLKSLE